MLHRLVFLLITSFFLPICQSAESNAKPPELCAIGDGLAVWNSNQCLLEQNFFEIKGGDGKSVYEARVYFEGRAIGLDEEHETISVIEGNSSFPRPGPKPKWAVAAGARTFSRDGIRLTLRQGKVSKCDYEKTQCTVVNFRASLELKLPGRPIVILKGVGFEGS